MPSQKPQALSAPAPKNLALAKETLRCLSPAALRLAAVGFRTGGCAF